MRRVRIGQEKRLAAEPGTGHSRYHPDIAPVGEGEEAAPRPAARGRRLDTATP